MKKVLLLTITFVLTNFIMGQTFVITNNPTFDSVMVVPNNPTNNDSVKFIIHISNEIPGRVFYKFCDSLGNCTTKTKISNDSIYIYELSMWPFSDTTEIFIDTVSFGKFNPGQYNILLINEEYTAMWPTPPPSFTDTAVFNLQIMTSIFEVYKKDRFIKISPIPTNDKLFISTLSNKKQIKDISIFDLTGKEIFRKSYNNYKNSEEINTRNLGNGTYFIKVITNDNLIHIEKIIIM